VAAESAVAAVAAEDVEAVEAHFAPPSDDGHKP
jgi:hypothetical protein